MAGVKISALPAVASALTTDIFPVVQAGVTSQETLLQVRTLFGFDSSTGLLAMASGGTNANLTAANGAVPYSTATAFALLAAGSSGQLFQSGGAGAPNWTTPTYPSASGTAGKILRSNGTNNVYSTSTFADTYTINSILYASSANTVVGLSNSNSSFFVSSATGVPTWLPATNGQIAIGSTGAIPVAATLTAGSGISIANGAGSITVSTTGGGVPVSNVTSGTQTLAVNTRYIANNAGGVAFTLPASASIGDVIFIVGRQTSWSVAQGAGQQIILGSSATTVGAGGSLASTNAHDCIAMVCTNTDVEWTIAAVVGTITIV